MSTMLEICDAAIGDFDLGYDRLIWEIMIWDALTCIVYALIIFFFYSEFGLRELIEESKLTKEESKLEKELGLRELIEGGDSSGVKHFLSVCCFGPFLLQWVTSVW
jgi:hypothetical protein